ncbi:MAG: ATP-binding protein [Candidatus Hadarchaeales archaeon]
MEENYFEVGQELNILEEVEKKLCFIGRKREIWKKYGPKATLLLGRIAERSAGGKDRCGWWVLLDSISPHVIFICGARGSGKSYTLGTIAEEIALKNPSLAVVLIDTLGVFWSMKYPNREEPEVERLKSWGLEPGGIQNVRVLIPYGFADKAPRETYDAFFMIKPAELSVDDWCLTFGISRYGPVGLLLDRTIEKVRNGYNKVVQSAERRELRRVMGKGSNYSIDDMIECVDSDAELTSKRAGFKTETRRALISRLTAAKEWGIFGGEGLNIRDIARAGMISVIDVSFLEENVRALVVGLLARKILAARVMATRKEAVERLLEGRMLDGLEEIPATWLLIDEAHTFSPSGSRKTAASEALIEFVKQGRRPGLTAVLATQQPSALSSKIISQVDMVIVHKLIFEDDIKAALKRVPTVLPAEFRSSAFIKMLPVGMAIIGDKETGRAFVASIRPRLSQHEGRESIPRLERPALPEKPKIWEEARGAALACVRSAPEQRASMQMIKAAIDEVASKHGVNLSLDSILMDLKRDGLIELNGDFVWVQKGAPPEQAAVAGQEILAIPFGADLETARRIASEDRRRRFGIFGEKERLVSLERIYYPLWRVLVDYSIDGKYVSLNVHIDAITGEILLLERGRVLRTSGVRKLTKLRPASRRVLFYLSKRGCATMHQLTTSLGMGRKSLVACLSELTALEMVRVKEEKDHKLFEASFPHQRFPERLIDRRILDIENLFKPSPEIVDIEKCVLIQPCIEEEGLRATLALWEGVELSKHELIYYPYWRATFADSRGITRNAIYDGLTGERDVYAEYVLRRRL